MAWPTVDEQDAAIRRDFPEFRLTAAAETFSSAPAAAKLPLRAAASNALMPLRKSSRRKSITLRKTDARAR